MVLQERSGSISDGGSASWESGNLDTVKKFIWIFEHDVERTSEKVGLLMC
jgi:hypothetical protein